MAGKVPTKPPYAQAPAVPKKKIAGANPLGNVSVGNYVSPTAPPKLGKARGLGPARPHGYGHTFKNKIGHLRMSGASGAIRIGGKKR